MQLLISEHSYAISDDSGSEPIFTPFPGYLNIDSRGLVIDEKDNDGRANKLVTHSNKDGFGYTDCHFKEYVFEVDRLPYPEHIESKS